MVKKMFIKILNGHNVSTPIPSLVDPNGEYKISKEDILEIFAEHLYNVIKDDSSHTSDRRSFRITSLSFLRKSVPQLEKCGTPSTP
jgi:hypothetical protein